MSKTEIVSRALSVVVAGLYAVPSFVSAGPKAFEIVCLMLLFPMALIWFPEPIGAATGYMGHGRITVETPPFLVALMGWVFLLGPVFLYAVLGP